MTETRSLSQRVATSFASTHYRLWGHRDDRQTTWVSVAGQRYRVDPGVFNPVLHRSGELFSTMLDREIVSPESSVLEIGTGCGLLAATIARWVRQVVATDIDSVAVDCARFNLEACGLAERCSVVQADLFDGIPDAKFDVVLTNPPFDQFDTDGQISGFFSRFGAAVDGWLTPNGYAVVCLPAWLPEPANAMREVGRSVAEMRRLETRFGPLALYRVT